MKYYHLTSDSRALDAISVTLDKMAQGGIYDHLGGGFARYSVDDIWKAPHFEKMLYDNGQLLELYANGYKLTKIERYKEVVVETADFALRELLDETGGFYSSYDADSEGEEGKFYVWELSEMIEVLGEEAALVMADYYTCRPEGNWEGHNILYQTLSKEEVAEKNEITVGQLLDIVNNSKKKLMEVRSERVMPGLDDKVLSGWNGLMISGMLVSYEATDDKTYLEAAMRTASFLRDKMIDGDFRMDRNYKNGKASINAFLDDYANVIKSFLQLYEVSFDIQWLTLAKQLTLYAVDHFSNDGNDMFYFTSDEDPPLVARKTDYSDNVIPGSNSVMARNLYKLSLYFNNKTWQTRSESMLNNLMPTIVGSNQPSYYSNWCQLMIDTHKPPYEIAILGPDAQKLKQEFAQQYIPNAIFLGGQKEDLPLLEDKLVEGENFIYVCRNKVCKFPVSTVEEAMKLLE